MKSKSEKRDFILTGPLTQVLWMLAVPIVLNSLVQTLYNLTDTYWVGNLGAEEMAAITVVTPVQNIVLNLGTGLTTAGAVLISQLLGARRDEDANDMARHIYLCTMSFSLFFSALGFLTAPAILAWLGATGETARLGQVYLQIVILDMPLLYTINMFQTVHQSQGDTLHPMLLNLLGVGINLVLDPLLIVVFRMGVGGAALATLVAKIPGAAVALYSLTRKNQLIRLDYHGFRWDKQKFHDILRIGLPTALGGSTMQLGFLLMSRNVLKYGAIATSAYGIGNKINGLISLPSNGIGSAVSTIVGQHIGAGKAERARKGYLLSMLIAVAFLFVAGQILALRPVAEPLIAIFSKDPEVIRLGTDFLCLLAGWCFFNGVYNASIGLFNGSGHTLISTLVEVARLWVFRFATLYVCESILGMGVESIWWSVVISNAAAALLIFLLYLLRLWEKPALRSHS